MAIRRDWAASGVLAAVLGGTSLAGLWPLAGIAADPALCLGLSPAQSWVGLNLHLVSQGVHCPNGAYAQGEALVPIFGISLAVSFSALLVGLAFLGTALGGGLLIRRTLRRVRGWAKRRLLPVVLGVFGGPEPVLVPVRTSRYRVESAHSPQQRRGPPSCC